MTRLRRGITSDKERMGRRHRPPHRYYGRRDIDEREGIAMERPKSYRRKPEESRIDRKGETYRYDQRRNGCGGMEVHTEPGMSSQEHKRVSNEKQEPL